MANLTSPGVQVSVTDESVYGPAGAGTVPMLFIATGEDKADPTLTESDGIAKYTKSANAGKPILVTSQRELTQYFGNVDFRKVAGTVQQGDETNEYGLLAAYSFLGQASAAHIVRADVNLTELRPSSSAPAGDPANNTYWLNPTGASMGIFEYTASGWVEKTPTVEIVSSAGAATATVVNGDYLVEIVNSTSGTELHYYKGVSGAWDLLDSGFADDVTFAPHYSAPSSNTAGDVWIKTTTPGSGLDIAPSLFTTAAGSFVSKAITYADASAPDGTTGDIPQDGSSGVARSLAEGDLWFDLSDVANAVIELKRYDSSGNDWDAISSDGSAGTGGFIMTASATQPTGNPVTGTMWFDPDVNELAVYEVASDSGTQKWKRAADVQYTTTAPTSDTGGNALADGDYWIDTDASGYPVIYRHNGTAWVVKDGTDQSTSNGVVFGDITANDTTADTFEATLLAGAPDPLVHPAGMTGINMCRSANTVREYDATLSTTWKWRNKAGNQASGKGSFGRLAQRKVVTTAMQASAAGSELREDTVAFRLIAAPGYTEMYDEMVTLNSDRDETAFVIVDAPFRLNQTEAVAWKQGTTATENGEDGLVTSNTYSAVYYPHALTTNPSTGDNVVAPASHIALYTYAYSDNVSFQWFAPAGLTRGVVQNATSVGYLNSEDEFVKLSLTQGSRDAMYEQKMNPIATFPTDGVVVFGQKSLHAGASALDRVNVARLTAYLRERFAVIARPYLFEPNDAGTRENAKATFEGFLSNIMRQRGVYDFAVVCDETNNTPARIDANEFYVDVAIEPTKSAEFIYIPIRIVNTGELS
jgi:phage tail sheath protein FI